MFWIGANQLELMRNICSGITCLVQQHHTPFFIFHQHERETKACALRLIVVVVNVSEGREREREKERDHEGGCLQCFDVL